MDGWSHIGAESWASDNLWSTLLPIDLSPWPGPFSGSGSNKCSRVIPHRKGLSIPCPVFIDTSKNAAIDRKKQV